MRTEERLAHARRSGDPVALLRAQLRAGMVTREALEVCAYVGHEAARGLVPMPLRDDFTQCRWLPWSTVVLLPLAHWTQGLPAVLARLPAVWAEEECPELKPDPLRHVEGAGDSLRCPLCNGTGRRVVEVSAERWWSVRVACWVAWECHRSLCICESPGAKCPDFFSLHAVERWLKEPTEENSRMCSGRSPWLSAWADWAVFVAAGGDGAIWDDYPISLSAAAEILGEPRVRGVIRDGLVKELLP